MILQINIIFTQLNNSETQSCLFNQWFIVKIRIQISLNNLLTKCTQHCNTRFTKAILLNKLMLNY